MTELISIRESSKHVDEEVRMHVWLTDKRSSGKIDSKSGVHYGRIGSTPITAII
ncbi:hypothetical protein ACIA4L_05540 [Lactobacillus delbrueckii subsp. bulgaricus]